MGERDREQFWLDHIGWVSADIAVPVAWLAQLGFRTSEPTALSGAEGPLGQVSAHCVFGNFYLEMSAPVAGSGNHLEPLLALGPGIRIVALGCADAARARRQLSREGIACGPASEASRRVSLGSGAREARFRWFALDNLMAGTLVAVVEHRDLDLVLAGELTDHANGARRIEEAVLGRMAEPLAQLLSGDSRKGPAIVRDQASPGLVQRLRCDNGIIIETGSSDE